MNRPLREERLRRLARILLVLYPEGFRVAVGREMEDAYVDRMAGIEAGGGRMPFLRTAGLMVWHSLRDGTLERMGDWARERPRRHGGAVFGTLPRDLLHAFRAMAKRPAFYSTVLLVFALGIAANTVVFSVVDGVLLRPLPYPEPDRLVIPWQTHPQWLESDNPRLRARWDRLGMAYPVYEDWKELSPVFQDFGLYAPRTVILTGGEAPERIRGTVATHGVFRALGVQPFLGRTFLEEEDRIGGPRLAILSHGLWLRRFGADPGVVGRTVVVGEEPHQIVGVMPRGFDFPGQARIWTTLPDSDRQRGRNNQFAETVARLKPGVTLESAQQDMEVLQGRLNEIHPIEGRSYGVNLVGLKEETVGDTRPVLALLLGTVLIFLAIACANITGLLLLRASERTRELAVRLSLGAGRRRIFGQLLTEGFLLSILGGGLGLALSAAALGPFLRLLPPDTPRLTEVSLDGPVLAFSLGLSVVTGILMSLAPGLAASGTDLSSALKTAVRGTTGGRRKNRTQAVLLVGEIALTFVLLVGAGLLTRSFTRLTAVDPGFFADGAAVLRMDMRGSRYEERERVRAAYEELCLRLEAFPGVTSVALASPGPFGSWSSNGTTVDTRDGPVRTNIEEEGVSPNYFETLRVPLVTGRTFTPDEVENRAPVVVVNAVLAETFWPGEDPIGKRVNPHGEWLTVVGVVGNVRRRLDREPFPTLFNPNSFDRDRPDVIIRTAGDPAGILAGAREALRAVDPDVPVISLSTLDATIDGTVAGPRVRSLIVGAFSVFAALLAVLGLFGLLAYAVTQQTREIGIRMALGAESGVVMREVLVRGIVLLAAGLALGFLVTLVAARAVEPFLFQVGMADPATFATVAILLSAASLGASVVPARRAMRVDPVDALKAEP